MADINLGVGGANSAVAGGYDIDNSCKFEANNTERMYRAWGSGGGNDQTWTVSLWVKRTELGTLQHIWGAGVSGNDIVIVSFLTDDTLKFRSTKNGANDCVYVTNRVFRDTSAWYHIVFAVDTTSGTAGDRLRIYINGVEETSFSTETNFAQNDNTLHNANSSYVEIATAIGEADRFCGYIAEVISISGSQLEPTTFGEYDSDTAIWIPKRYTGSFPQNSFKLEFKDSSSLGTETSGNGQTFTLQNITSIDQATDTPTNNFCIFNAVQNYTSSTVLSDGGTLWDNPAGQNWQSITGTFAVSSGKWYWEVRGATYAFLGIADVEDSIVPQRTDGYYVGHNDNGNSKSIGMYSINGQVYNAPGGSPDGTSYTSSSMIGFALDMDNRKMWISKDGTWISTIGDPTGTPSGGIALTNLGDYVYPAVSVSASNGVICAFGGIVSPHVSHHNMTNTDANGYGAFKSSPPSGYYSLCTKNLAEYG